MNAASRPAPRRWQVLCPAQLVTGGPEALHQLAHVARQQGIDARMVYTGADAGAAVATPEPYRIYEPRIDAAPDDDPQTLVIAPETQTDRLLRLRHAQRAIWWLSVDNHRVVAEHARLRRRRHWWKRFTAGVALHFDLQRPEPGLWHLAQSAYAREHLARHGVAPVRMLTDYLRDDFLAQSRLGADRIARQRRRVAYNPKKGLEATQAIVAEAAGRFEFVPIQNMSAQQVIELLCSTAVYMDFGHHPGRDRLPREAVACGCRVLTGRRGAAAFAEDVPVPEDFKLDESGPDLARRAVAALERLVAPDPGLDTVFDDYRRAVTAQKQTFADEVAAFARALEQGMPSTGR